MKQLRYVVGIVIAIAAVLLGVNNVRDDAGQVSGKSASATMPASHSGSTATRQSSADSRGRSDNYDDAADRILEAFNSNESDLWIEAGGTVAQVLSDDSEGSRHQRFIVKLPNAHTVLIAHNIDLAQRVPLKRGDDVTFYGEYEWNDRGGVVHWTHHDPRNKKKGGWIKHRNTTYR